MSPANGCCFKENPRTPTVCRCGVRCFPFRTSPGWWNWPTRSPGRGIELVSTGGTRKAIADAGLPVTDVSDVTGFPEIMDGRVKTLHPAVHGGLLAVRDDPEHVLAMEANGIRPFDLVVINLYPFEEVVEEDEDDPTTIENIDIGGPAMVRASAKNHAYVTVATDPADYGETGGNARAERRLLDLCDPPAVCAQGVPENGEL